jgi:hypothetical protein
MKKVRVACISVLFLLGALANSAKAATLVDLGSFMLDRQSDLDWLDPSATQGLAYNDIVHNIGVNYIAQGWRFATLDEVHTLFDDAGGGGTYPITLNTFPDSAPNPIFDAATMLASLLGYTSTFGPPYGFAYGIVADQADATHHFVASYYAVLSGGVRHAWLVDGLHNVDAYGGPEQGAFLVRTHLAVTPLPGALPLFVSAMAGLGLFASRTKARRGASPGSI